MDNQNQQSFEQKFNAATNTADTTSEFDQNDINQNKIMAILAYFGILVLIPIFTPRSLSLPVSMPIRACCSALRL